MPFWRRKRAESEPADDRPPVVLGQQMADALAAEKRHKRGRHGESPLKGVAYNVQVGEFDLHRFVESATDDALAAFTDEYASCTEDQAAELRARLTMDDLYALIHFVRRSVFASLQGRDKPTLDAGLAAVTAVDSTRVDWRDASVAAELIGWGLARAGRDHAAELRAAASRAEEQVAEMLAATAARPADELEPGMWRCVTGPDGPIFVTDYFERFEPTADLIALAFDVQSVLEADRYRVGGLTVGSDLPEVWLAVTGGEVEQARRRVRACVIVSGDLRPEPDRRAGDQRLLAFLAEADSPEDAALIASATKPTESYEAVGVHAGPLCCVLVANSSVIGVRSFERAGSLERFRDPLQRVLDSVGE